MTNLSDVVWTDILNALRRQNPAIARGWFSQLRPGALDRGCLEIYAANSSQLVYLNRYAIRPFVEAAQSTTGRLVSVVFRVDGDVTHMPEPVKTDDVPSFEREASFLRLNADYTFDHFVTGPCNRMAHAASVAVGDAPGTAYNPLFIHGDVGLGKTHLLQAMCHRILDRSPNALILYLTCETFVNHFIEAVERGALNSFRYRYRHVDMLVIDDIQFLSGRERSQEEFFHTFNTLYQSQRQIILSADCPPLEIPTLEDRLVSRFNWGLVTRVDQPCLETRQAIVRKKLRIRGIEAPECAVEFVAARISSNTRELEGAINRICGLALVEKRPIDLRLVHEALGEPEPPPTRQIRIQDIMNIVTERFNIKLSDLQGRSRSRSIALPRHVCMYLARQHTNHSLEEIGGFFGGRDHTTVLHANKIISGRRESDQRFRARLDDIEGALLRSGSN